MSRLQVFIGKAEYLETAGITDDPKVQLVPLAVGGFHLHEASQPGLPLDSSIGAR